jgi:hypothetical protein
MKKLLGDHSILNDLKLRASYAVLGDDRDPNNAGNSIVPAYAYLPGYNYNTGTAIIGGNPLVTSADKGLVTTNISWLKSKITDVGLDFTMLNNKVTGSVDYFIENVAGCLAAATT